MGKGQKEFLYGSVGNFAWKSFRYRNFYKRRQRKKYGVSGKKSLWRRRVRGDTSCRNTGKDTGNYSLCRGRKIYRKGDGKLRKGSQKRVGPVVEKGKERRR